MTTGGVNFILLQGIGEHGLGVLVVVHQGFDGGLVRASSVDGRVVKARFDPDESAVEASCHVALGT